MHVIISVDVLLVSVESCVWMFWVFKGSSGGGLWWFDNRWNRCNKWCDSIFARCWWKYVFCMFINIQWIECKQIQFINVNLYINDFQCEISWKTCYDQNYRFEWCCLGYRFFCVRKQKVSTEIFKEKQTEKRRSWKMRPSRDSRVVVCWTKSEKKKYKSNRNRFTFGPRVREWKIRERLLCNDTSISRQP